MDLEQFKYGKVVLKPMFTRNTHYNYTAIIVVGCGGTGGRIIPLLAQHIANHNKEIEGNNRNTLHINHKMHLFLIDNKSVLPKNLDRQNFFQFDLMKNKAQVFAERYSALYGIDIKFIPGKYSTLGLHSDGVRYNNAFIFDCTDNKQARDSIEKNLPSSNNVIISCGNEADFGQVMYSYLRSGYGTNRAYDLMKSIGKVNYHVASVDGGSPPKTLEIQCFPTILELFRDFKDTPTASCDEVLLVNEQSMPINSLVGQLAYNIFYDLVSGLSLNYHMVKCNIRNVFSTQFVSTPTTCLKQLYRGLFGIDDYENAAKAFAELYPYVEGGTYRGKDKYSEFVSTVDRHPIFCIPFIKTYINQAYWMALTERQDLEKMLSDQEQLLKKHYGIEEPEVKEEEPINAAIQPSV